uniref:Homeobox-leucine zipper protein HDG11-like n=1 Tax=Cicer arietinum TaxID=3827 RepID=A0A3Q7XM57_CICAR|nr:homeobox-leucine zipper protein HDG11-like [Cicer arietinum]
MCLLLKNQEKRVSNSALRNENDMLQNENNLINEALKSTICSTCGGPPFPQKEHELFMKKMGEENDQLKQEIEKVSTLISRYKRKEISLPELELSLAHVKTFSHSQMVSGSSSHSHNHSIRVNQPMQNCDVEKSMITQIATIAMEELIRLVRMNEPFWVNSSTTQDAKLTLIHEAYEQVFPKKSHFKGPNIVKEASKYSAMVNLSGMILVDIFLDPVKWAKLFPTMVKKCETIKVFETGVLENGDISLQLMYEKMHILSPLVRPREFNIIRYCKQIGVGTWMIANVSYDSSQPNTNHHSHAWKYPSGCMIRQLPNGTCVVTWVEHVEVNDEIHTHHLYKDLIGTHNLYGAESWIKELQRMCEKTYSFFLPRIPDHESGGVIETIEGRKSVMRLSHRMVRMFCECLTTQSNVEFPSTIQDSIGGIRVSFQDITSSGQPNGKGVVAIATLWTPLPSDKVFEFLIDPTKRSKWDVLAYGNRVHEIAHISNGYHHGNFISLLKPFIPSEKNVLILQENFTSHVGSYVIFAGIDIASMNVAIRGEDTVKMHILPSGFVVCPNDQKSNATNSEGFKGGSLLTLAYEILSCSSERTTNLTNVESAANARTLLTTTLENVKKALMNYNRR